MGTTTPAGEVPVCLLWDYENVRIPTDFNGYTACSLLRKVAMQFGPVRSFKAYMETALERGPIRSAIRTSMQSSGVTIADTPHNGGKEVADKQLIVDLFTFALDHPTATFVLVTGDKDFAYSCSTLRNRLYKVIVICPETGVAESLRQSCDEIIYWRTGVLQLPPLKRPEPLGPERNAKRQKHDHRPSQPNQDRAYYPPPPYHQPQHHLPSHYDARALQPQPMSRSRSANAVAGPSSARMVEDSMAATLPSRPTAGPSKEKSKGKGKEKGTAAQLAELEKLDAQLAELEKAGSAMGKKVKGKKVKKSKVKAVEVIELTSSDDEEERHPVKAAVKVKGKGRPPGRPHSPSDVATPPMTKRRPPAPTPAAGQREPTAELSDSDADDLIILPVSFRKLRPRAAVPATPVGQADGALPSSAMDTTVSDDEEGVDGGSSDETEGDQVTAMLVRGQ